MSPSGAASDSSAPAIEVRTFGGSAVAGGGGAARGSEATASPVVMATRRGGNGMAATIPDRLVVVAPLATFFEGPDPEKCVRGIAAISCYLPKSAGPLSSSVRADALDFAAADQIQGDSAAATKAHAAEAPIVASLISLRE
jgi:hypothetical protein